MKDLLKRASRNLKRQFYCASRRAILGIELLEKRELLATISWINSLGGSWHDSRNWDLGRVPELGDDVLIANLAGEQTINFNNGTTSIASLSSSESLRISGGTLRVSGSIAPSTLILDGGVLEDGTILQSVGIQIGGGTLDGVTINGNFAVSGNNSVNVVNGLTLNGVATLGDAAVPSQFGFMSFAGAQTLGGSGTVVFGNSNSINGLYQSTAGAALTIGSGITVRGKSGSLGYHPNVSSSPTSSIVNQGTIHADAAGGIIQVGSSSIRSPGLLKAESGTTIVLPNSIANTGNTLDLSGSGSFIVSGGVTGGTIRIASASKLIPSGTFDGVTINGDFQISGNNSLSVVNGLTLNGTITLGDTGQSSQFGFMSFQGAQTLGGSGTVVFGNSNSINGLYQTTSAATLTIGPGITLRGQTGSLGYNDRVSSSPTAVVVNQGTIQWDAGTQISAPKTLVNNGSIVVGSSGVMNFDGRLVGGTVTTQPGARIGGGTLDGVTINGNFAVSGNNSVNIVNGLTLNGVATLGDAAVPSQFGFMSFAGAQTLGGSGTVVFGNSNSINGLYQSTAGAALTIGSGITVRGKSGSLGYHPNVSSSPTAIVVNQGIIQADVPSGTITIRTGGGSLNAGTIKAIGSGNVVVEGANWTSTGTLESAEGSVATINASVANVGQTIVLNGSGTFLLSGAITGGTISVASGAKVFQSGTLDGVTINGNFAVSGNNSVNVVNGLTLNGVATLGDAAVPSQFGFMSFAGAQTLGGSGTVVFGNSNSINGLYQSTAGAALTIGSGITVRGKSGSLGYHPNVSSSPTSSIVNQGTIHADAAGGIIQVGSSSIRSPGLLKAESGTTIVLPNSIANTGNTLDLSGSGSFIVSGGVTGGTIRIASASKLIPSGTFDGVTINGDFQISGNNSLSVVNGLTLNGTITLGDTGQSSQFGFMSFQGAQTLGGSGTVVFGNSNSINGLYQTTSAATLTIGPGITLRGQTGSLGYNDRVSSSPTAVVVNQGTIQWDAGTQISAPKTLVNNGSIVVGSSGVMNFDGRLVGGTVTTQPGARIGGGTLDGVTINGNFAVSGNNSVNIVNGLTLNGVATLGDAAVPSQFGFMSFAGAQTLGGSGTVVFGNSNSINGLYQSTAGAALTIGSGITVRGKSGSLGYHPNVSSSPTSIVVNQGLIQFAKDTGIVFGSSLTNRGSIANNGQYSISISDNQVDGSSYLSTSNGSTIEINGNLIGSTTAGTSFVNSGVVEIKGGTAASPRLLEAMSLDKGLNSPSATSNFYYNTLRIGSNSNVRVTDQFRNSSGTDAEVLYVGTLVVPTGSTLDLQGRKLYARLAKIDGTILGGAILQIPDGGPLQVASPTSGTINLGGEVDEWTFFSRQGRNIAIALNPTISGKNATLAPTLDRAQFTLVGPTGATVASASNANSGGQVLLTDITLSDEGLYRLQIRAASNFASNTGNYVVAYYDAIGDVAQTSIGSTVSGAIENEFNIDRWNFSGIRNQQIRFDLLASNDPSLSFSLTGPGGFSAFTDLKSSSVPFNLPSTGNYQLTARSLTGDTGQYTFKLMETLVTELPLGQTVASTIGGFGSTQLFRIQVGVATPITIRMDDASQQNGNVLLAKFGSPPTLGSFEYTSRPSNTNGRVATDLRLTPDPSLLIPHAMIGEWFVMVYGEKSSQQTTFSIQANSSSVVLVDSTPNKSGSNSNVDLQLFGAGFVTGASVSLVSQSNIFVATATNVQIDSYTQLSATLPLTGILPGQYNLRVTRPDGNFDTLRQPFTVLPGGEAKLETKLIMPSVLGIRAPATIYVEYANTGTVAMAAPLLRLQSSDNDGSDKLMLTLDQSKVVQGSWGSGMPDGISETIQILGSGVNAGLLNPGEKITVPVYYVGLNQPAFLDNNIEMEIRIVDSANSDLVPWPSLKEELRPNSMTPEAWDAIFGNLTASVGKTWGDFVEMLSDNAKYLSRLGRPVTDVGDLWSFEIQQAIGYNPISTLASSVDAAVTTPGSDLTFNRFWSLSLDQRFETSLFGRGWSTPWQTRLTVDADGAVNIIGAGGSQRRFSPDSRYHSLLFGSPNAEKAFFKSPAETGSLVRISTDRYELHEQSGSQTRFRADGLLDFTQDASGNKVTAGYDSSKRLTSLTHSNGASIAIAYNSAGLIQTLTDSAGRATKFTYDSSNQYLLTSIGSDNVVTSYSYDSAANSPRQHSLTSVTSGGVTQTFQFDSHGRLSSTATRISSAIENARINFTYDTAGRVAVSDSGGGTTNLFYDERGLLSKVSDPFGNVTTSEYGSDLRISRIVDPLGQSRSYTWCGCGSLTSSTDQLGNKTTFTQEYVGPNNTIRRMTSFTDANGNTTRYTYDVKGNLTSTIYPNGTIERTSGYDPFGDPLTFINRRGQVMQYAYNSAGQIARQTFDDGSFIDLSYDAKGNLTSVTEPSNKVTTYSYDSGDRLTKVLYPQGRYLEFSYDNAGRRATMTDQLGYVVRYSYDAGGRLFQLRDTDNTLIVEYLYDTAGRLSRKNNGNNTYTVYSYDVAGQVLSIYNRAPNDSLNSSFVYTYDVLGRRDSMTSIDGKWTYAYDGNGQLVRAVFTPVVGSSIPAQDLSYVYDPLGNRIRTIENGITTEYTTNNLNQYTKVGDDTLTYDADGNLTFRSGQDRIESYDYDVQSRLVRIVTPDRTWLYEYDAFGNRTSSTTGEVREEYLNDPMGLVNVTSEYTSNGLLSNRFVYGLGLVLHNQTIDHRERFFDFDAVGNASVLTSNDGDLLNRYGYSPFGAELFSNETVSNSFQFAGQFGVKEEAPSLKYARARFYSDDTGAFVSQDPIGIGDGINRYTYSRNRPTQKLDPSGLASLDWLPTIELSLFAGLGFAFYLGLDVNPASVCLTLGQGGGIGGGLGAGASTPITSGSGSMFMIGLGPVSGSVSKDGAGDVSGGAFTWGPSFRAGWFVGETTTKCWPLPPKSPIPPMPNFGDKGDEQRSEAARPRDPNELIGPTGYGLGNFVLNTATLPYRINFENYGPGSVEQDGTPAPAARWATAPAQKVEITNVLPAQLDLQAFVMTGFGFGDINIPILTGAPNHEQVLQITLGGKSFDVWFSARLDNSNRVLRFVLQSIDPDTELPPDVLTGFLPPEDGTGRGKGYVSYLSRPLPGLANATEIRNTALISFDGQLSISTDQVDPLDPSKGIDTNRQALVTIDSNEPTSQVLALPAKSAPNFKVIWSGSDGVGSEIATYDIYVSENSGPATLWLSNVTQTEATFNGLTNRQYAFFSVAKDNVGLVEPFPSAADSSTTTTGSLWQNPKDPLDVSNDGRITPSDALQVINVLNSPTPRVLDSSITSFPPYIDVNGSGTLTPSDALIVINFLNSRSNPGGEGEVAPPDLDRKTLGHWSEVDRLMADHSWYQDLLGSERSDRLRRNRR